MVRWNFMGHEIMLNEKFRDRDDRPAIGCYAPGGYIVKCIKCKYSFIGDKRAGHCAPCAYDDDHVNNPSLICSKIDIYRVTFDGFSFLEKDFNRIIDFLRGMDVGENYSVVKLRMTVNEYENLPEFQGF